MEALLGTSGAVFLGLTVILFGGAAFSGLCNLGIGHIRSVTHEQPGRHDFSIH